MSFVVKMLIRLKEVFQEGLMMSKGGVGGGGGRERGENKRMNLELGDGGSR